MDHAHDAIQALIEQFDFDRLAPTDKVLVLEHLTEAEYQQRRKIVAGSIDLFEGEANFLMPDPQVKANLKVVLGRKRATSPAFGNFSWLFTFRLPAYQVGIGTTLLVLAMFWWGPDPAIQIVEREKIVFQPKTDTVVVNREVVKEVPVVTTVTKIEYIEAPAPVASVVPQAIESVEETIALNNVFELPAEVQQQQLQRSLGNTAYDKDDLQMLVLPFR